MNEELMEQVLDRGNLNAAYRAVRRNKGAPGVDGISVEGLKKEVRDHWEGIERKLRMGTYQPGALRAKRIAKPNGGERLLGIPTTLDRLIQQATLHVLGPIFEKGFSEHSYGFRPGRSAHDAVRKGQEYVKAGKQWIVDIDLKAFFDQVNHDKLMQMVGQEIKDKRLLRLIGNYLRAPMQERDGSQQRRTRGAPQGGPLSPLLANIYLTPLDKELEKRGVAFVRYADDVAIFASSPRAAERILESVVEWLRKELKLEVNRQKSGSGPSGQSSLLGFRLYEDGRVGVAPKATEKLKKRVRELWNARQSLTSEQLRDQWQSYIRGWWNYFKIADWRREVTDLSGWIRRHIRKCFWLRWHNPRGRIRALRRLGVVGQALGTAYTGQGAWAMAAHVTIQQALKTSVLNRYDLNVPWDNATRQ